MTLITTPAQSVLIDTLSETQLTFVRQSYGINDFPYQPDRTYIVFDAASGNNNLHIDTGSSLSYSILKGDGTVQTDYTDTGGTKVLNYDVAGRYLITIDGTFQGINTDGASAGDKNKYIGIIGGSNYPSTLPVRAFLSCTNLEYIYAMTVTTITAAGGSGVFESCTNLKTVELFAVTTIGANAFYECDSLVYVNFPSATSIGDNAFYDCDKLTYVNFPSATSIGDNAFYTCEKLINAYFPSVTTIGDFGFYQCYDLLTANFPLTTTLGQDVFRDCGNLLSANFPSLTSTGNDAFNGCVDLRDFRVDYSAGLTFGVAVFTNVYLSDLYVDGGNITTATAVQAKLTAAAASYLAAFRLLY